MATHQRNGHSKRRPNGIRHLISTCVDVDSGSIPGTRLVVQGGQEMFNGFAVRLQVDANDSHVVARSNKSRIYLQRSLIRLHSLR